MSNTCYRFVVKLDRNLGVVLEYRAGTVQDLDVLARIGADAFSDYPLFRLTEPELRPGVTFDQFHFALHRMLVKIFLKRESVLVACEDGKPRGYALLQKQEMPFLPYLLNGGVGLLKYIPLKPLLEFLTLTDAADQHVKLNTHYDWFLEVIAVHPEHQGRGIGTGMLDVGIAKFVKAAGGSNYAFVTNTAKNARFYDHNGCRELAVSHLDYRGQEINVWAFKKELDKKKAKPAKDTKSGAKDAKAANEAKPAKNTEETGK